MGDVSWQIVLSLILAWIIVYLCLIKGVASSGKVSVTPTALACEQARGEDGKKNWRANLAVERETEEFEELSDQGGALGGASLASFTLARSPFAGYYSSDTFSKHLFVSVFSPVHPVSVSFGSYHRVCCLS